MYTAVALGHLATALAIGLLLGVEREHDNASDSTRPAGSRTFPLIALAGAISAALSPVALGAVAALLAPQSIPVHTAVVACGAALATNTVVKLVLATVTGGPRFVPQLGAWLAAVALGMAW
ncbi:MgtC/SapB family protein [Lentzea sp. NPDC102401]|uniref:MgtC/SapB family protein n=1 Tax=Lentzea sp. NPDC102401 TaxID=3364128 RepID=UPI0038274BE9